MRVTVVLRDGSSATVECEPGEVEFPTVVRDLAYFLTMGVSPQMWYLMGTKVPPEERGDGVPPSHNG